MQNFDKQQLRNLIVGIVGILAIYLLSGIVHENLYLTSYTVLMVHT